MPLSQEDVANVDRLCQQLYTCASNDERRAAEQQLAPLSELANMDNVLHLVGQSSSPATTFVACVALRRMVTSSWEQLTMVQMCALQDFVVHVLNTKVLRVCGGLVVAYMVGCDTLYKHWRHGIFGTKVMKRSGVEGKYKAGFFFVD